MSYADRLKILFAGADLDIRDLFLLEAFQLKYLPERLPEKEFSAVLQAYPDIYYFMINKQPLIENQIESILDKYDPAVDKNQLKEYCDKLIWEIAELLVYVKYPELYDSRIKFSWDFKDVTSIVSLRNKTVIDAGAGTGRIAFMAANDAETVVAVEPCARLRQYIWEKAVKNSISNVFAVDGFLHAIPFPENHADVLITSNAIGWQLDDELKEIERVVKPGGYAVHLTCSQETEDPLTPSLAKPEWQYYHSEYKIEEDIIRKYWKQIK